MSNFNWKSGWHPESKGGGGGGGGGGIGKKLGGIKGASSISGLMGKGKDTREEEREAHVSRPLSSLKDRRF